MKIVYHPQYLEDYSTASCECPERISSILDSLKGYEFIKPEKASRKDIGNAHSPEHIRNVRERHSDVYEVALRSAGGALKTAEIALVEPAFGLIRPPGHHASRNSAWGFCFFNNMAVALLRLKAQSAIEKALILDIDLHFGDGTVNILGNESWISILNVRTGYRTDFLEEVETELGEKDYDIVAVSAGFDTYEKDWGGILKTEDYFTIGDLVKNHSDKRFALLEGGYYLPDLGKNVKAFVEGFQ